MPSRSLAPRLSDIIEAIERIGRIAKDLTFEDFEADGEKQWAIQRGIEIISEASRHLTEELRLRHPDIPWRKVAGVGNVLRHDYGDIAAPVIWGIVRDELVPLERVCRVELVAELER
jgi:uncharacterized protein with HEPN domain